MAVTSVFAAYAAIVDWRPSPSSTVRRRAVFSPRWPRSPSAQLLWVYLDALGASLVLLVVSVLMCEAQRRRPEAFEPTERLIRASAHRTMHAAAGAPGHLMRHAGGLGRGAVVRAQAVGIDRNVVRVALTSIGVGVVYFPVLWRLTNAPDGALYAGINDFPLHVDAARRFSPSPCGCRFPTSSSTLRRTSSMASPATVWGR